VLRLDELWGEILLSKSLGFALVVLWVWYAGRSLETIGPHSRNLVAVCTIGGVGATLALAVAYGVALGWGGASSIELTAIDPKTGLEGGALFAAWLVFGNVVNALMEEAPPRGHQRGCPAGSGPAGPRGLPGLSSRAPRA
jgi:hypothetical protein